MKQLTRPMRNVLIRLLDGAQTASLPSSTLAALKSRGLANIYGLTPQGRSAADQIRASRLKGNRDAIEQVKPS